MAYQSTNPVNGDILRGYASLTDAEIDQLLDESSSAFRLWQATSFQHRASILLKTADLLESRAREYARIMALEMGKPLAQGEAEAKKCAWVCRYYAENGEQMLQTVPQQSDGSEAYLEYDPIGPILAIMPWNFPFWQLFRHAAPAVMAGNVIILKHAPNVPQCAQAIEQVFHDAGLEEGIVQNAFLPLDQVPRVIEDRRIRGVTLTGSTRAGREVASMAGKALKKTVLELGGSDPFMVLPDANLDEAIETGVKARCLNSGQSCIAAKRFLIHESIYDEFVSRFTEGMKAGVMGDPLNEKVNIGPQARFDLRDHLADQVSRSIEAGAELLCGGEVPDGKGAFYPPTVLSRVKKGSPAWTEELFGPVAAMIPVRDEEEMISIANNSVFGLGASLWTKEIEKAKIIAGRIESGAVFINGLVKSDPRLPFGGIKDSGCGRELGREGIIEFMNAKTVWIK